MHVSQAAFWLSLENIFKILGRLSWNTRAVRTCWFRKRLGIYYLYKHISSWLNIRPVGASQSRVNWGQIWRWPSDKPFIFILLTWVDKAALIKYKLDNKTTWVRLVFTYKQKKKLHSMFVLNYPEFVQLRMCSYVVLTLFTSSYSCLISPQCLTEVSIFLFKRSVEPQLKLCFLTFTFHTEVYSTLAALWLSHSTVFEEQPQPRLKSLSLMVFLSFFLFLPRRNVTCGRCSSPLLRDGWGEKGVKGHEGEMWLRNM